MKFNSWSCIRSPFRMSHCVKGSFVVLLSLVLMACSSPEEKAEQFFTKAEVLFEQGRLEEAKIEYRNALTNNSFHIDALMGLASIHEQKQEWPALYKTLNSILDIDPEHLGSRVTLTELMLAGGELDRAMENSSLLLELAPDNVEVLTLRAATLMKLEDKDGGAEFAQMALAIDPNHVDAMILMATEKLRINDLNNSQQYIDRALDVQPDNLLVNGLKIQLLTLQGNVTQAAGVYEHLISISPTPGPVYKSLANYYIRQERVEDAEATLRRFAKAEPSVDAHIAIVGFVYQFKGDDAGDKELDLLIKNQPNEIAFQLFWIDVLLQRQDLDKARQQLNTAMQSSSLSDAQLSQVKNRLASIEAAQGNTRAATLLVDEVLARDAQNLPAVVAKARIQLSQGQPDLAVSTLRTALSYAPKSPEVLRWLARAYQAQGSIDLAEEQYQVALTEASFSLAIIQDYAEFLMGKGERARAEELLDSALNHGDASIAMVELLAQVKLSLGKWEEAEQIAKILEEKGADKAMSASLLGRAYFGMERFDRGIASLEDAQRAAPADTEPMMALVAGYVSAKQPEKALAFLESVLKTDPDNHHAHFLLGVVYQLQQKYPQAEASYQRAIDSEPVFTRVYLQWVSLLEAQDKSDAALHILDKGLAASPESLELTVAKAERLHKAGKLDAAIGAYRVLLSHNEEYDVAANNLASLLTKRAAAGDFDQALVYAERFRRSRVPHFQDTLGWLYLKLGKNDDALYLLEQAAEDLAGLAEVRYHLGVAYYKVGRKPEALRELGIAQEALKSGADFASLNEVDALINSLQAP